MAGSAVMAIGGALAGAVFNKMMAPKPTTPAAPCEDAEEVLHRRSRRRGDESKGPRHLRQRHLVLRGKEPLGEQPRFERLEFPLQPAHPVIHHCADLELILPMRLVDADFTQRHNLQPITQDRKSTRLNSSHT